MKINGQNRPYHLCFETFANELRVKIVENLKERPMNVEEIAKKVNAERSAVSHSLRMLRDCNYVDVEKAGKQRVYSIKKEAFDAFATASNEGIFKLMDRHMECMCQNECKKIRG